VAGISILYISLTRAGLEKLIQDEQQDKLRKIPVTFEWVNSRGEKQEGRYKFPETTTLPTNPLYFLKKMRDELWIVLTNNPIDKARVIMLITDKRMEEAMILNGRNANPNLIAKTINSSLEKMTESNEIIKDLRPIDKKEFKQTWCQEFLAYRWIINSLKISDTDKMIIFGKMTKLDER